MKKTLQLKQRARSAFLSQFRLDRRALILADPARGVPALRAGIDKDGYSVLIKTWPREKAVDDSDLREIWRNEMRQMYRLAGYRGVSDYIVELRTSTFDDEGYHLVLNAGQRRPLELHLSENDLPPRLNPESVNGRRLIWANLVRVARGLDILHSQGLLHRNLTTWSILTACEEEPDFQLTGFEWSMRITGQQSTLASMPSSFRDSAHSFTSDWQQFGDLAIRLLNVPADRIQNHAIPNQDIVGHLTADEVCLIRGLTRIFPMDRVDGRVVAEQIAKILTTLTSIQQNQDPAFHLVVPLGANGPLAAVIREASGRLIETSDEAAQREFIENDLSSPIAMSVKVGEESNRFKLVVRGERLTYYLDDFKRGKDRTPSNWELAYCVSANTQAPQAGSIIRRVPMSAGALTLVRLLDARDRKYRLRSRVTPWTILRHQLKAPADEPPPVKLLLKSLVLTQMLDYLFAASDVFPVSVSEYSGDRELEDEGRVRIAVRPRRDVGRDELSNALGLKKPPAVRLVEALTGDQATDDRQTGWILTDSPAVGDRSETATEWQFEAEKEIDNGERIYVFSGDRPPSLAGDQFLIPRDSAGRDAQLRRRMKSFEALADHRELSNMLVDPRKRVHESHDTVIADTGFQELDSSKQAAFRAAVETLPLFLIQGPPGVGKTRLVRELARQVLSNDKSLRLLLSAQSNYAVDHLLNEIEAILPEAGGPDVLVVRCISRDRKEKEKDAETPFDVSQQAKSLLANLLRSDLLAQASFLLRERAGQVAVSYGIAAPGKTEGAVPDSAKVARKALEQLVLRSANLVFATANSGDLARLIEERAQFDWVIVEEAAKATGAELVSPLLLSPRRLMIGDHKQLPPFNAERIAHLLEHPRVVKKALEVGDQLIGRAFRDRIVEEIYADIAPTSEDKLSNLADEAIGNFSLFETLIEDEFGRQRRGGTGKEIAAALTKQHRMHPAIAKIVSAAFYDKKLLTDEDCEKRFRTVCSPVDSRDVTRLPNSPVVWIDMPWVQQTSGMKHGERFPRFINYEERDAVEAVSSLLAARNDSSKKPTLAILSPYSRQVSVLGRMIQSKWHKFTNLKAFRSASKQANFCNTVDSFQGSEADCVVISLVRNNNHGSIHTALGFLADPRRMNVLMSRAKSRLIIVGSLDFLKNVDRMAKSQFDQHQIEFLGKILKTIESGDSGVAIVPVKKLLGLKS